MLKHPAARVRPPLLVLLVLAAGIAHAGDETTATEPDEATMELGREVFLEIAQPPCGICHALADAEAAGTVAPSLDSLRPTADEVRNALIAGPEAMPSYADILSEEEIDAVAEYVAAVAGED